MVMVYNPNTGRYEDNGLGLGAAVAQSANDLGTIVRGGLQGVGNAVGSAVVNPLDRARALAAQALGGDPNNLAGGNLTDQSFALMDQGFADAGAAANRFGTGLRNTAMGLVGAVNAPPVVAAPAAPALVPPPAPAVAPPSPQTPAGIPDDATGVAPLTAQDLAPANVAIAQGLAQMQAPAAGGNYGPGNNGINFGFGVNGSPTARQVLDRFAQQDAQARLNQNAKMDQLEIGSLMSAFNDPFAKTQDKKFIMHLLGMRTDQANKSAALAQGNNLGVMDLTGRQATATAALANQREIAAERTQAALQAANITGQYGLQAAQTKAGGALATQKAKDNSPEGRKAAAEAALLETRLNAALAAVEAKKIDPGMGLVAATRAGQNPLVPLSYDPQTGLPNSPEAERIGQANQLILLRRQNAKLQQQ